MLYIFFFILVIFYIDLPVVYSEKGVPEWFNDIRIDYPLKHFLTGVGCAGLDLDNDHRNSLLEAESYARRSLSTSIKSTLISTFYNRIYERRKNRVVELLEETESQLELGTQRIELYQVGINNRYIDDEHNIICALAVLPKTDCISIYNTESKIQRIKMSNVCKNARLFDSKMQRVNALNSYLQLDSLYTLYIGTQLILSVCGSSSPSSYETLSYLEELDNEIKLAIGRLSEPELRVEAWIDWGKIEAILKEGDKIYLYVCVSQPCYIQLVNLYCDDGTDECFQNVYFDLDEVNIELCLQNVYLNEKQVYNDVVVDSFRVVKPFSKGRFQLYASKEKMFNSKIQQWEQDENVKKIQVNYKVEGRY